jgi:toluene monooxygenase system protein A
MPAVCNLCQIPISNKGGVEWKARVYQLDYEGRRYNFCSPVCKWVFETEPVRYKDFESIVDRMYNGTIVPNTGDDVLRYMSAGVLSPKGKDAHDYAWAAK